MLLKDSIITQKDLEFREAMLEFKCADPLAKFSPNAPQLRMMRACAPNNIFAMGNRVGKSFYTSGYLPNALARGKHPYIQINRPGKIGLFAENNYKFKEQLKIIFESFLHPDIHKWMIANKKITSDPPYRYEFPDGTRVIMLSADMKWDSQQGDKWSAIIFDEQPDNYAYWQQVIRGAVDFNCPIFYGFTPTKGLNFVYEHVYKKAIDPNEPNYTLVTGNTWENCEESVRHKRGVSGGEQVIDGVKVKGHLSKEGIERFISSMNPTQEACFVYGEFLATEDNIHPGFRVEDNVVHIDEEEWKDWVIVDGLDFGQTSDPTAIVRFAIHPEHRKYHVIRAKLFEKHALIKDHIEWMNMWPEKHHYCVIDSSCGCKHEYMSAGVPLVDMRMDIGARDATANAAIDSYVTWRDRSGRERVERRLTIEPSSGDMEKLIEHLMMLRAKKNKFGATVGHVHTNTHLPDAFSYALHWSSRNVIPSGERIKIGSVQNEEFERDGYRINNSFYINPFDTRALMNRFM